MKLVIIESPYAGDVQFNLAYGRKCVLECLKRGEAPLASHLLYTQVLDDKQAVERQLGISAGLEWYRKADLCVLYADHGISSGMQAGMEAARLANVPIEIRYLGQPAKDMLLTDKMK